MKYYYEYLVLLSNYSNVLKIQKFSLINVSQLSIQYFDWLQTKSLETVAIFLYLMLNISVRKKRRKVFHAF